MTRRTGLRAAYSLFGQRVSRTLGKRTRVAVTGSELTAERDSAKAEKEERR